MKFAAAFAGQSVCIGGAGGYIGAGLVKALAPAGLRLLTLLDTSEFGLFQMQRWMRAEHPGVACEFILGSVDDARLLDEVFGRGAPQTVFHAAAFKHVGLLEHNAFAAMRNNALATLSFADAAERHGVGKFILISTDKAVNPHSVMGASKRIAELFTLARDCTNAVRLGNVIGSTGSVVPLFLEEIEAGRPLTVTHPDATRYFLSRGEAVEAVMAAGLADRSGTVLLPALGTPIRIADLARSLAAQRGLPVRFSGLRPGEKLTEDLVGENERVAGLIAGPLTIVETRRLSRTTCSDAARALEAAVVARDFPALLDTVCVLVPEYSPSELLQTHAAMVACDA